MTDTNPQYQPKVLTAQQLADAEANNQLLKSFSSFLEKVIESGAEGVNTSLLLSTYLAGAGAMNGLYRSALRYNTGLMMNITDVLHTLVTQSEEESAP